MAYFVRMHNDDILAIAPRAGSDTLSSLNRELESLVWGMDVLDNLYFGKIQAV